MASLRRYIALGGLVLCGCTAQPESNFPEIDPVLYRKNMRAGDPHRGYFSLAAATSGLASQGQLRAILTVDGEVIECELLEELAPVTVANFVGLARGVRAFLDPITDTWTERPYYDGLAWHRAALDRFVQTGKTGNANHLGYHIPDEFAPGARFDGAGIMAMANGGARNSGCAEFFITTQAISAYNDRYTIFGRCNNLRAVLAVQRRVLAGETPVLDSVLIERVAAAR